MSVRTFTLAAANAAGSVQASAGVTVADPPSGSAIVKLGLVFAAVGLLPWAFGQTFARGHVPTGASVVADCAEFQCVPWSFHDDGSVRDAHVAGYCQVSSPGIVDVAMRLGSPVASPSVQSGVPDVQITIAGTRIAPSLSRTIVAGPVMLHEQWTCKLDPQVAVVYETRTYRSGETQVIVPCVENCGFLAATQPNRRLALKVTIGGKVTFTETVNVRHHTRISLLRGSAWTYWIGADSQLLPDHDRVYLCASESVPPYSPTPASTATIAALPQAYAPNDVGEDGDSQASGGYAAGIGLLARHNLYYLTTGGARAWNYMWAGSLVAGSASVHLRDETTGALPSPAQYPTHSWQTNLPHGSGGELYTSWDIAHHASRVYVAAKVTGWRYFVDEHLAHTLWNHFYQQPAVRQNGKGILRTDVGTNQDRGGAWALRTLAQAISLCPHDHPLQPELVALWQNNMAYYKGRYVDGTIDGGRYVNNLGVIAPYSANGTSLYTGNDRGTSTAWWGAGWQQYFVGQALGHALQMKLPVGAQAQADLAGVFAFAAKFVVGMCGDGSPTAFNWRRFGVYALPFWPDGNQFPPGTWYANFGQVYAEYITAKALLADPLPPGTIKKHSSEADIDGAYWQFGFTSYPWPALVYAVMHQAPGAAAALARIMASPSWPLIAAGIQNPIWTGMMPPGIKHPGAA